MSEGHFTYLSPIVENADEQKIITAVLLGLALYGVGCYCKKKIDCKKGMDDNIIPDGKITCFSFFDVFVEKFISFFDSVLGKENRKHLPFMATVFMFVLFSNLLGLIPGVPAITTTVQVNVAMAIVTFIYFNFQGVKEHGFLGYLKHFCGPIVFLAWFMFPLEIFSTTLRILTLNLRLYWNITADHLMLGIITDSVCPYFAPALLYILGIFVSFMQAFVFTTLNMVYIKLATEHEEAHECEHA